MMVDHLRATTWRVMATHSSFMISSSIKRPTRQVNSSLTSPVEKWGITIYRNHLPPRSNKTHKTTISLLPLLESVAVIALALINRPPRTKGWWKNWISSKKRSKASRTCRMSIYTTPTTILVLETSWTPLWEISSHSNKSNLSRGS